MEWFAQLYLCWPVTFLLARACHIGAAKIETRPSNWRQLVLECLSRGFVLLTMQFIVMLSLDHAMRRPW
jgi:hypothetical protein